MYRWNLKRKPKYHKLWEILGWHRKTKPIREGPARNCHRCLKQIKITRKFFFFNLFRKFFFFYVSYNYNDRKEKCSLQIFYLIWNMFIHLTIFRNLSWNSIGIYFIHLNKLSLSMHMHRSLMLKTTKLTHQNGASFEG